MDNPGCRTAKVMVRANGVDDGLDSSESDDAQQRSASAWVTTRAPSASSLCIGQSADSQHDRRASGVASQPAHSTRTLGVRARTQMTATSRRYQDTTLLGCLTPEQVSNDLPTYLFHGVQELEGAANCGAPVGTLYRQNGQQPPLADTQGSVNPRQARELCREGRDPTAAAVQQIVQRSCRQTADRDRSGQNRDREVFGLKP